MLCHNLLPETNNNIFLDPGVAVHLKGTVFEKKRIRKCFI